MSTVSICMSGRRRGDFNHVFLFHSGLNTWLRSQCVSTFVLANGSMGRCWSLQCLAVLGFSCGLNTFCNGLVWLLLL